MNAFLDNLLVILCVAGAALFLILRLNFKKNGCTSCKGCPVKPGSGR